MFATFAQLSCLASALLGADAAAVGTSAPAVAVSIEESKPHSDHPLGWLRGTDSARIQIDNDLFAGTGQDRGYTGGFGITLSGNQAREGSLSLDPLLRRLDRWRVGSEDGEVHHARQVGLMAFTPSNTAATEVQPDDRPYASLLFQSNGRVRVDAEGRGAWATSLTVGVLGLSLSERLHGAIHRAVGSESPRGYAHQISAGGEPTARYTLARQKLWLAAPGGHLELKTTVQGSLGFLTETSASFSLRAGRLGSPWWSFAPELTDYLPAPVPTQGFLGGRERYFFLGARVRARAYNVFLQGQFRHSDLRLSSDEVEPLLAEAWAGVVTRVLDHVELSYRLHYQTGELRHGPAARESLWGAVQLTFAF